MGQVSLISEYIVHTHQSCAYVAAASLYATKLNYAQLSALSFYSHERHHSKTGRRSSDLLSYPPLWLRLKAGQLQLVS